MKERLVSIFLILSIVASLFAISAVSTSAASTSAPSKPTLQYAIPINNGTMLCVRWTHNSLRTKNYRVWISEAYHSRDYYYNSNNWKFYDTSSSSSRYLVIKKGLKQHTTYIVKVSAIGTNGKHSDYSNGNTKITNLSAVIDYADLLGAPYDCVLAKVKCNIINSTKKPNQYYIKQYVDGTLAPNRLIINGDGSYVSGPALYSQRLQYKIQAVYIINNAKYTSGWSYLRTASYD